VGLHVMMHAGQFVATRRKLDKPITLAEIKAHPGLDDMILTRRGNRLSIMPIDKQHWDLILTLE
jgi:predicted RNA-binding protein with PUA-like domain